MAKTRVTHSRQRRKRDPFSVVRGKVVESVEVKPSDPGYSIGIMFQDRTFLSFDVEPQMTFTIMPELSDWKTHNYKPLKRWPPLRSE